MKFLLALNLKRSGEHSEYPEAFSYGTVSAPASRIGAAIGLEVWAVAEMDTLSSHERGAADYDNA